VLSSTAKGVVFSPLETTGRAAAIVQRFSDAISLGMLRDGERLPTQQELASSLRVSLVALREAIAVLTDKGMLETRRGHQGGSFVRCNSRLFMSRAQERLGQMSSHEVVDLGDMLRAVSGNASRLAAERGSAEISDRLSANVHWLELASDFAACRRADSRFHIEVAAASQSVRITRAQMDLQARIGDLAWLPFPDDADESTAYHAGVVATHERLVSAIGAADARAAQSIAERHVDRTVQRLLELQLQLTASS
jgi:DNA-binding FadR family transcriptional regulator